MAVHNNNHGIQPPTRRLLTAGGLGLALVLAGATPAHAQEPPGQRDTPLAVPETATPAETLGRPGPVLPPPPAAGDTDRLIALPAVRVEKIIIRDASLLSPEEIDAAVHPFEGRMVTIEELQQLRYRLSLLYFDKGYVNSGVLLPDQEVKDGTIYFQEIRGTLTDVQLSGNSKLRDSYILARVDRPGPDQALQINDLQTSLQLLEQNPVIRRIDAELLPGVKPGEAVLRMDVAENSRWQFVTGFDNHRSPAVGGEQATLLVSNRSLTGRSDRLDMFASYAEGLLDGYLSYTAPLNPRDTTMSLYAERSDTDILEGNFNEIDIKSTITTVGILFDHPLHRSLSGNVNVFAGFEYKHTENKLLGSRFSFTPGEDKGETDLSVFQAGTEFSRLSLKQVMAMRFTIRRGLHIFGATQTPATGPRANTPDGQFTSLLWQAQYIRNLDWRASQLFLRTSAQWAANPLLSAEKMPVGGYNTVRGYRENLFVRDNGFAGSVEWQVPLFETDRTAAGAFDPRRLRGATFFDYGASKDKTNDLNTGDTKNLYTLGLGLLWDPKPGLHADVYWGYALKDFDEEGNDIQDDGFTFRMSYRF